MANRSGVTATLPFGKVRQALSSRRCSGCNSCRDPDRGRDSISSPIRAARSRALASALTVSVLLSSPGSAATRSRTVVARFSASGAVWSEPPVFASALASASNAAIGGGLPLRSLRCVCSLGENDRVNSAQGFQILSANEFFADKPNRDLDRREASMRQHFGLWLALG